LPILTIASEEFDAGDRRTVAGLERSMKVYRSLDHGDVNE
jgi:hypothetical protein